MKKIILQVPLFLIAFIGFAQGQQQVPDVAGKVPVKQGAQTLARQTVVKLPLKQGGQAPGAGVAKFAPVKGGSAAFTTAANGTATQQTQTGAKPNGVQRSATVPIKSASGQEKVEDPSMLSAPLRSSDNSTGKTNSSSSENSTNSTNDAKKP